MLSRERPGGHCQPAHAEAKRTPRHTSQSRRGSGTGQRRGLGLRQQRGPGARLPRGGRVGGSAHPAPRAAEARAHGVHGHPERLGHPLVGELALEGRDGVDVGALAALEGAGEGFAGEVGGVGTLWG